MSRARCHVFVNDGAPRYVALWSIDWSLIESRYVEPDGDFGAAIGAAIDRARLEGWAAEGAPDFAFVFLRRGAQRRLLMLTRRDPSDSSLQSFSPFRT